MDVHLDLCSPLTTVVCLESSHSFWFHNSPAVFMLKLWMLCWINDFGVSPSWLIKIDFIGSIRITWEILRNITENHKQHNTDGFTEYDSLCFVSSNQICFTSVFVDFSELLYKMTMQMSESKGLSTFILKISFFLNKIQCSLSRSDTHMITHGWL